MTKLQELKKEADDAWVAYFANAATDTNEPKIKASV